MRIFIFAVITCAFLSVIARAEIFTLLPRETLNAREGKTAFMGSYFNTTQNLTSGTSKVDLANSGSFSSIAATASFEYGLLEGFTFFSDIQYVYNSVKATGASRYDLSPANADAGLRYSPAQFLKPFRLIFEGSFEFPMYSRFSADGWANGNSSIPAGDGASSISYYNLLELPTSDTFYLGFGFGYTYRTSGFSDYFPYALYLKYENPKDSYVKIGAIGTVSINNDNFTNVGSNERAATVIAGSDVFNSINPSYIKADVEVGFYLSQQVFAAGGFQLPFIGKNIAYGPLFLASIGYNFGNTMLGSEYSHSNRGFQEYTFYATILQANNTALMALINKGANEGIHVGDIVDVFEIGPDSQPGETLCRAKVIQVGPTKSKIQVIELFKDKRLQEGFVVRKPLR